MRLRQTQSATPNTFDVNPGGLAVDASDVCLRVRNDRVRIEIVDHVTLRVKQGEFVALVGPSGCGKTSLLHVVAGLTKATSGTVSVFGRPPQPDPRRVMFAFARDVLLPWRTVFGNVALPLQVEGLGSAEVESRVMDYLRRVGLQEYRDSYRSHLSQGMRQRVALARTLAMGSQLLLMDEPFAALDAQTRILMQDVLLKLLEDGGRSVLFVTHDLTEAIALADRVVLLSRRPCRVKADYRVPFGRPRDSAALRADPEFVALFEQLWQDLKAEVKDE